MDLIKKLGGYEKAKDGLHRLKLEKKDLLTCGDLVVVKSEIDAALIEYRRQHNIFEAGDRVVGSKLFDDRIFEFQYCLPELSMAVISKDGAAIGLNQLKHATDAEIAAGHRL